MTLSLSEVQEWWMNLAKDAARNDDPFTLLAVLGPFVGRHNPTPHDAVTLFWELYQPKTPLRVQDERGLLDCLDWMYENYRVPYEPDSEDDLGQLVIYLHIAAARAFQIRRDEGGQWSEESLSCLKEVDHVQKRLFAPRATKGLDSLVFSVHVHPSLGLCLVELSRDLKNNGEYALALHYLAEGVISHLIANDFVQGGDAWDSYQDTLPRPDEDEIEALRSMLNPESTEGGPWGQPLKKRGGAPMNLG